MNKINNQKCDGWKNIVFVCSVNQGSVMYYYNFENNTLFNVVKSRGHISKGAIIAGMIAIVTFLSSSIVDFTIDIHPLICNMVSVSLGMLGGIIWCFCSRNKQRDSIQKVMEQEQRVVTEKEEIQMCRREGRKILLDQIFVLPCLIFVIFFLMIGFLFVIPVSVILFLGNTISYAGIMRLIMSILQTNLIKRWKMCRLLSI